MGSLTVSLAKLSIYFFFWHSHICFLDNVGNCHKFRWFTYTLRIAVNGGLMMRTFYCFLFLKSFFLSFLFFVVTKDQPRGIVYQQLLWHCSMDQKVMRMQLWLVGTEMLFYFL